MKSIRNLRHIVKERASALIISLVAITVLGFAAAALSVSVSTTANVSLQAATWQEAIMAAEAGADTGMASLRAALDQGQFWNNINNALSATKTGATAWTGWTVEATDATLGPTRLSLTPVLRAATAETPGLQAAVTIERLPGSSVGPWYRVRSTGAAGVVGPARVGADKRDNILRRLSLRNKRPERSGYKEPNAVDGGAGLRQVTRAVELLVRPLPSGTWDRAITSQGVVKMGAKFIVDSYHSGDTSGTKCDWNAALGVGIYNPAKRGHKGDIASNAHGDNVSIGGGFVYGSVQSNGGTAKATQNVTGPVTNKFFQAIPAVPKPTWFVTSSGLMKGSSATPTFTISSSSSGPTRVRYDGVDLGAGHTLRFTGPNSGKGEIEMWVTKDFLMSGSARVEVASNVKVTIWIEGKLAGNGGTFANNSFKPENLRVLGVSTPDKTTPQWEWNSNADFYGTIEGPDVKFKVTGAANFYGAVIVNTVDIGGSDGAGFHFDEALLNTGGATPRYTVASWIEDVR